MAGSGFELSVKDGLKDFLDEIDVLEREQLPFVTAVTLTQTAKEAGGRIVDEMARVFDRPTRFALNALFVRPATKQSLVATVDFKEGFGSIPASRFLGPEVEGGKRAKKSHERALERAGVIRKDEFVVPAKGMPLDAFGNVPGGELSRIMSQIGASPDPMQNATARSRKRHQRKGTAQYFVSRGRPNAPDGIYRRAGRLAVPALIFVQHAPRYRRLLPFYEIAERTVEERFGTLFKANWEKYVVAKRLPF